MRRPRSAELIVALAVGMAAGGCTNTEPVTGAGTGGGGAGAAQDSTGVSSPIGGLPGTSSDGTTAERGANSSVNSSAAQGASADGSSGTSGGSASGGGQAATPAK